MKKILLPIFFLMVLHLQAQNGTPLPGGIRGMAMGNTGVSAQDVNSIFSNQSGLAFVESLSFVAMGEQRFAGTGIGLAAVGVAYPVSSGTFGLNIQYFGIDDYKEQKIGLSYARKLFDNLALGVQFDYLNTRITDYGSAGVFTFEIGFTAPLSRELVVGGRVFSPMRVSLTDEEDIPGLVGFGLTYMPSKKVSVSTEVEKGFDTDFTARAGIEYWIRPEFALRVGGSTGPVLATFGLGYHLKKQLYIDLAATYHQVLGVSPGFGIRYAISN